MKETLSQSTKELIKMMKEQIKDYERSKIEAEFTLRMIGCRTAPIGHKTHLDLLKRKAKAMVDESNEMIRTVEYCIVAFKDFGACGMKHLKISKALLEELKNSRL